jgi:hypothetical protein
MYEQYTLDKATLELDVHDHLQEIRFQLDEHREVLKGKIDDIYMENDRKKQEIRGNLFEKP